jgi:uncharacterized membrane protein
MMEQPPLPSTAEDERLRTLVLVSYILMGVGLFVGLTAVIAVVICHIKRSEAVATIYESHFTWLIRTFWWSLLGMVIAAITSIIGIGIVLSVVVWAWVIYRLVKGFLSFNDRRPVADPQAWV